MSTLRELREAYRRGELDKHAFARALSARHAILDEYRGLLAGSDIARLEVDDEGLWLHSRLAPLAFACRGEDRGSAPVVALAFGTYEREELASWLALLPRGARVADVGANVGWFAAHTAAADPTARIVAFEPVPATAAQLRRTVRRNGLATVTVEAVAVSDHARGIRLQLDAGLAGAASEHPTVALDAVETVPVPSVTLDAYAASHGLGFDAIKIDVEGGEFAVLRGAQSVLRRDRPMVLCELLRRHARAFGYHPNDVLAWMRERGYRCHAMAGGTLVPFAAMDESTVETNFVFLPEGDVRAAG